MAEVAENQEIDLDEMLDDFGDGLIIEPKEKTDDEKEKQFDRQYQLENLRNAIYGTRIINNKVVVVLRSEILNHFAIKEDAETIDAMNRGKKYTLQYCSELCQIIYQLKYWFDLKCKERKKKHSFYKTAADLNNEICWISILKIKKYLKFLAELEIVYREQGKFKLNPQVWTYTLNMNHPVIEYIYLLEGAERYINYHAEKEKVPGSNFINDIFDADDSIVFPYIENKVMKSRFEGQKDRRIKLIQRGYQIDTAPVLNWTGGGIKLIRDTNTTGKTKTDNELKTSSGENRIQNNINNGSVIPINGKNNKTIEDMENSSCDFSPGFKPNSNGGMDAGGRLVGSVQAKWDRLTDKQKKKVQKLFIPVWRRTQNYKDYPADNNPYEKSDTWLESLPESDQDIVREFQADMWDGYITNTKQPVERQIKQEYSDKINRIDVYGLKDNFMQWCHKKLLIQ